MRAFSWVLRIKGGVGGDVSRWKTVRVQTGRAVQAVELVWRRRMRNTWCRGEIHRYQAERRLRRKHLGDLRPMMNESVGIKKD